MIDLDDILDGTKEIKLKGGTLGYLRSLFPSEGWKAVREGFGWSYINRNEDTARWVSCIASAYPDDDNTFQSQFYVYRKGSKSEYITSGPTYSL